MKDKLRAWQSVHLSTCINLMHSHRLYECTLVVTPVYLIRLTTEMHQSNHRVVYFDIKTCTAADNKMVVS